MAYVPSNDSENTHLTIKLTKHLVGTKSIFICGYFILKLNNILQGNIALFTPLYVLFSLFLFFRGHFCLYLIVNSGEIWLRRSFVKKEEENIPDDGLASYAFII